MKVYGFKNALRDGFVAASRDGIRPGNHKTRVRRDAKKTARAQARAAIRSAVSAD